MTRPLHRRAVSMLLALLAAPASGQQAPEGPPAPETPVAPRAPAGTPAQGTREATWPAPTAEDWKKPCLIAWQRTWEDAQAVSKETGKPILVCVNMDGE